MATEAEYAAAYLEESSAMSTVEALRARHATVLAAIQTGWQAGENTEMLEHRAQGVRAALAALGAAI